MVPLVSAFIKTDSALRMLNEIVFGFLQLEVVHVEPPVDISAIEDELVGGFSLKSSKQEDAKELLLSLSNINREVSASDIREKAQEKGISWRTMELVKKEIGIQSKKVNNAWYWILDSKYF